MRTYVWARRRFLALPSPCRTAKVQLLFHIRTLFGGEIRGGRHSWASCSAPAPFILRCLLSARRWHWWCRRSPEWQRPQGPRLCLSGKHHLSARWHSFYQYFKERTGQTFINYLNDYRLQYAKRLLETKRMKVVAVAEVSGFRDVSYFNRYFKQKTGVTPTEYMEGAGNRNGEREENLPPALRDDKESVTRR